MASLQLTLFGSPRVERDGVPAALDRRKAVALLAYLALAPSPQSRDHLAELLWPERDGPSARTDLRSGLYAIRQAIGSEWLELDGERVALGRTPELRVDVLRFRDLLAQVAGHAHGAAEQGCEACAAALAEAVALYSADFLAGFTLPDAVGFDDWQTYQTESLRLELGQALESLARLHAECGDYASALGVARRWLELDPLCEEPHRVLMRLYAGSGNRASALRQYEDCVRVLDQELGIKPDAETTMLYEALAGGQFAVPGRALPTPPPLVLPPDHTPFIGRATELAEIAARLSDPACRMLTVLGPGGSGKTRLAVQAARMQAGRFADGIFFVDLQPVESAGLLAPAIALAVSAPPSGAGDVGEILIAHLRGREMLLVLDNFEHLMDGVELPPRLLDAAPGVKLLITSRARLNLVEEWLLPLGGMALPPEAARKAALEDYSGTALFLAGTSRLRPDYVPTSQEAAEIVHICRLLEGMPLGIELAAARSRTMPVRDIAASVAQGLDVLTATMRDLPARHRSMAAAFDASWRLLTLRERHMLCCASVFRGGFTPEAAAAVAATTTHDLEQLADSCWLRVEADGRWGMHELIRQYCEAKLRSEHLSGAGEGEGEVRARHVAYFRSFVLQKGETCLWSCEKALQETRREYGNLLAAWDGFVAQNDLQALRGVTGDFNWLADRLAWWASALQLYGSSLRRLREALELEVNDRDKRRRLELALAWLLILRTDMQLRLGRLDDASAGLTEAEAMLGGGAPEDEDWGPTHLMLLRAWATTCFMQGNYADSTRGFREMLDELHAVRVPASALPLHNSLYWEAEACWIMGFTGLYEGRYEEGVGWAQRSIQIARGLGSELCEITAERPLAVCLTALGRFVESERLLKRMLRAARRLGERYVTTQVMNLLGHVYYAKGQPGLARIWAQRCATLCQETNLVEQTLPSALANLATAELALDHVAAARHHCQRGLALLERSGGTHLPEYANLIVVMGWIALAEDDAEAATAHARRALASASRMANTTARAVLLIAVALSRQGQTEHAVELASAVARPPLTSYATRQRAAGALRELESKLPPEVYAAAVARGEGRDVNELALALLTPAEDHGP